MNNLVLKPGVNSVRDIENFMDSLCDNLLINDTYYGNMLISINTINDLIESSEQTKPVQINYSTDYKILYLNIQNIEEELYKRFKTDSTKIDSVIEWELIKQLSDSIIFDENNIIIGFVIGAVHDSIYKSRLKLLLSYFNKVNVKSK